MFKSPPTNLSKQASQDISLVKTIKSNQNVPNDILEFLARQLTILKDISNSLPNTHPDILTNRLNECVHLLEKKLSFSLSDNPEQYHDYIQDFYENQMNSLRAELNQAKYTITSVKKQHDNMKKSYDMLIRQKQYLNTNLETSRIQKYHNENIQKVEEVISLKKQLDHCRILLEQNNQFIDQQSKVIEQLSAKMQNNQKEHQALRQKYESKVLAFDEVVNKHQAEYEGIIKQLKQEHKTYQINIKDLSLNKIRIFQQRINLEKQLQIKMQEVQLLTKKVLQHQILIGKLERTTLIKQKLIDELYQQIDSINGSLSRIGRKQGQYQKTCYQKGQEILKLEQRMRLINEANEKLQKKLEKANRKYEDEENKVKELQIQLEQYRTSTEQKQKQNSLLIKKSQSIEKNNSKITKEKQKYQNQMKLMEEKYQDLLIRNKEEKHIVKNDIMKEVNELVTLVQQKQKEISVLAKQAKHLKQELTRQRKDRENIQKNNNVINDIMEDIKKKMDFLQTENVQLLQTKLLLENQILKLNTQNNKIVQLEYQCQTINNEKHHLLNELNALRSNYQKHVTSTNQSGQRVQNNNNNSNSNNNNNNNNNNNSKLEQQKKQWKQQINKKEFQIKQLESKIKTLQQEIKDITKLFQNQKYKMLIKIKELEQLLRERYDHSSRVSYNDDKYH